MVGNGVTNWTYDTMPATVEVAYWRSLLDQNTHDKIKEEKCDYSTINFEPNNITDSCMGYVTQLTDTLMAKINVYNIYGKCYNWNVSSSDHHNTLSAYRPESNKALKMIDGKLVTHKRFSSAYEYTPWLFKNKLKEDEHPPCTFGGPLHEWTNDATVRKQLHVPDYV